MTRSLALAGMLLAALVAGAPAAAEEPPAELLEKERAALEKVAAELERLSRFCVQNKAYAEARAVLDAGLAVHPASEKLRKAREGVEGQEGEARESFAEKYPKKRDAAFLRCAKALASPALLFDRKGFPERFDRLAEIVRRRFPTEDGLAAFELAWYRPYRRWLREEKVEKLEKGFELVEGEWLDPKAVEEGNAKHRTWADPWVVSDGVHEVRTTFPLRKAVEVLHHASAFREFFLSQFEGEWDLRPPAGRLPIELCETQADFQARVREASKGVRNVSTQTLAGAAMYHWTSRPLNPCLVTHQPVYPSSRGGYVEVPVGEEEMLSTLQHELAHQIGYEYSRHSYIAGKYSQHCYWAMEGLAHSFSCYLLTPGGWRLSRKRIIPHGEKTQDSPFAWCKRRIGSLPPLVKYFEKTDRRLDDPEDYLYLATAACFLLHGADGRYRKPFLAVLEVAHQIREDEGTFAKCFEGVDIEAMQRDWVKFVEGLELE